MAPRSSMGLGRLSLRQKERGLLAGGTRAGKSTLADALGEDFLLRYRNARRLILDTKPRYRAQWLPNGLSAARLYKHWDHGEVIPGSVLVETPAEMLRAFKMGHRTCIVSSKRWAARQDACCEAFLEDSRAGRPQLLQVDETCHHFYSNGAPKGSGALVDVAMGGAERGCSALYCTQRTKGISPHLLEHMDRLYAFRLDAKADAKRFQEFGAPPITLPQTPHRFVYWTKADYTTVYGPYQLSLDQVR
jgi:hypothetical protein